MRVVSEIETIDSELAELQGSADAVGLQVELRKLRAPAPTPPQPKPAPIPRPVITEAGNNTGVSTSAPTATQATNVAHAKSRGVA